MLQISNLQQELELEKDHYKSFSEDVIELLKNLPLNQKVVQGIIKRYSNVKTILKALLNELSYKIEELQLDKDQLEGLVQKLKNTLQKTKQENEEEIQEYQEKLDSLIKEKKELRLKISLA